MIFTFPQNLGFFEIIIGLFLFYWIVRNQNIKHKNNDIIKLKKEYSNSPNKIFDLKDYPSLTYKDLVEHFGKDEVNLIKG